MSNHPESFQEAVKQGHSAAWDQAWDKAAIYYRQALEASPDNPAVLIDFGLALYQLQNYPEALKVYQRAAEVSPNDPLPLQKIAEINERLGSVRAAADAYWKSAELYARNRDMDKAIEHWSHVSRLDPGNIMAHSRLALVYERLGKKQQAVTELLAIGSLMQRAGDLQKAIQAVTHAMQVVPDSKEATQALSLLRAGQQLPRPISRESRAVTPAAHAFRQIEAPKEVSLPKSNLDPIGEARQRALASLAALVFEQPDEAPQEAQSSRGMQAIVQGVKSGSSKESGQTKISLHLSQAVDLQTRGDDAQALTEIQRAVEAGLDSGAADYDAGLLLTNLGRGDEALPHLMKSVKSQEFTLGSRLLLAQSYQKAGKQQEAAIEYLEALKLADCQIVPKSQVEELRKLYDPLVEALPIQVEPYFSRLSANVADMLLKPNWREHMLRARQQLPATAAGSPPVPLAEILSEAHGGKVVESIARIHQLARAGYHRSAMEEAYYALQQAPTYLPLHTNIGELLLQQGHTQNALEKFNIVARSYSIRGEARRAIDIYRRVIELAPMDLQARQYMIDQYAATGEMETAMQEYLNLADIYYSLADLTMARKTYAQALRAAQKANMERSWKVKLLKHLADIDLQSLDWREALRIFEQIKILQPEDESARSELVDLNLKLGQVAPAITELDGYLSMMRTVKTRDQMIAYLESLVSENPRQPAIRRRLAEFYKQNGQMDKAVEQLDETADLFVQNKEKGGAIEAVNAILALNPPNAANYQSMLAKIKESKS